MQFHAKSSQFVAAITVCQTYKLNMRDALCFISDDIALSLFITYTLVLSAPLELRRSGASLLDIESFINLPLMDPYDSDNTINGKRNVSAKLA